MRIKGGGTASLKALGFNHRDGLEEVARTTPVRDAWQLLNVDFTPTRSWAVVQVEGSGTGTSGHQMFWDDVSLTPM